MEMLSWFSERVGSAAPRSGTAVLVTRFAPRSVETADHHTAASKLRLDARPVGCLAHLVSQAVRRRTMWHRMAGRWIHQHRDGWQGALNTQGFGLRGAPMCAGVQTTVGRMPNMLPLETRVSTHKPSCGRVHQHGCFLKQPEPCGAIQFVSSCNYSAARRCHGWYDRVCTQSGRRGERHIERRGAATDFRCPSEAAAGPIGSHARRRSFVLRKDVCRSTNGRRHQHGSARRQRRE